MTEEELQRELRKLPEQLWIEYEEKLGKDPIMEIKAPNGNVSINFFGTFHPMKHHQPKTATKMIKSFIKEQQLKLC